MKPKTHERGQALIMIALAAVGLFAFTALAIDGSRVFSDYRHAQNAADTSALAAALGKIRADPPATGDTAAQAAGTARAASNGFDNTNSIVEVHRCDEPNLDPPCTGIPAGADPSEYLQVVIRSSTKTTFTRVIGRTEIPFIVSAIARAVPGGLAPVGKGSALSAMSEHDAKAIWGQGNFNLDIMHSGLFDNSDHSCGFTVGGASGNYTVDTAFNVVSNQVCKNPPWLALNGPLQQAERIPYPPRVDVLIPSITCTGDSVYDAANRTYSPGFHHSLNIPNGTITFAPGNHCFDGGVNISGNTNIIAFNANFLVSSGDFKITSGNFTCNNLLIHINGGTGFHIGGNTTDICEGLTIVASTGDFGWTGNPTIDLKAPTWGPYKGLLVYLPYGNSSPLSIDGNSHQTLTGSIIAVSSPIVVNGNSDTFSLSTEIIGYTVKLSGNGTIVIDYDPEDMFQQLDPTLLQMTK
jgi:hypothetical protein